MSINNIILYDDSLYTGSGNLTASTTATGFDVDNVTDWRSYTLWKGTGTSDQFIAKDYGSAFTADSFGLQGHDLFTQGATIVVQYSTDNFAVDINDAFTPYAPTTNSAQYRSFTSQSKRYWRFKISGYTAAPFLGNLKIGPRLTFPIPLNNGAFDSKSYTIKSSSQDSQVGNPLGSSINSKQIKLSPRWSEIDVSFVDGAFKTFWDNHASIIKPFFWIWNSVDYPEEVFLCRIPDNFRKNFAFQNTILTRNIPLEFIALLEF